MRFFSVPFVGLAGAETIPEGFARPVFPALGTSVRLAALSVFLFPPQPPPPPLLTVTTLSVYDWAAARGQMSATWDSYVSFCHF